MLTASMEELPDGRSGGLDAMCLLGVLFLQESCGAAGDRVAVCVLYMPSWLLLFLLALLLLGSMYCVM